MNRITILHENYRGTQTDITSESFSGTRIMNPGIEEVAYRGLNESVYQVFVISGDSEILVGEHPNEIEAQEQAGRIWVQAYRSSDEYLNSLLASALMENEAALGFKGDANESSSALQAFRNRGLRCE